MAASENDGVWALEPLVNQWVLDYFFHLAMVAFRSGRHDDFSEIRDIVSVLIQRPFKCMEQNTQILRIMQCFSRIEEGEDPDCTFDQESSETPLESAVGILDIVEGEMTLDKNLLKANKQMLKEAAVVACVKKKQFRKASKILKRLLSNKSGSKQQRSDCQHIIQEKNLNHPLVANFSLSAIKEKIYKMFEEQIDGTSSFLITVRKEDSPVRKVKGQRRRQITLHQFVMEPDSQHDNESENERPNCAPPRQDRRTSAAPSPQDRRANHAPSPQRKMDLARHPQDIRDNFAPSPQPRACSPREDSPVRKVQGQRRHLIALHQFVMAPDSQHDNESENERPNCAPPRQDRRTSAAPSPQDRRASYDPSIHCKNPKPAPSPQDKRDTPVSLLQDRRDAPASSSQDRRANHASSPQRKMDIAHYPQDIRANFAPSPQENSANLNPSTHNTRASSSVRRLFNSPPENKKRKPNGNRVVSSSSVVEEQDTWSEEDFLFRRGHTTSGVGNKSIGGGKKQKWTVEESEWIKQGVKEVGEGNWAKILKRFPFQNRTAIMIKDRWRTMKRLGLV
ncbi:telomeric repeat-binding factor 2 [Gastrophryne carolinensis]